MEWICINSCWSIQIEQIWWLFKQGGKRTLPAAQHIAKVGEVRELSWSLSLSQNLAPQWIYIWSIPSRLWRMNPICWMIDFSFFSCSSLLNLFWHYLGVLVSSNDFCIEAIWIFKHTTWSLQRITKRYMT